MSHCSSGGGITFPEHVPPRDLLQRHGWWIAIAVIYLYVFPYFPKIRSANELPRVYLVKAMTHEGRFAVDTGVARWGSTADVSPSGGHHYSNKAPGSSMLALPVYAAISAVTGEPSLAASMWICRVAAGIAPTILFLILLYGFLARVTPDVWLRRFVVIAYALGSMAMTFSVLFYSHQLAAVCIASAWMLALDVAEGKRGRGAMVAAGVLAGAAPLADYQAVFAALPVAVHVVIVLVRARRGLSVNVALATAGALIPIAILLAYHAAAFGGPFRTGYDASTTFAHFHQQGFLGITELRLEAFWGSLFRPDNGLFFLAPWLLLALPGFVVLARGGQRGLAAVGASVLVIYVLFVSSINFWRGGWGVGPRYITAMLPFLLPAVTALLAGVRERRLVVGALASTIVVGVAVYTLANVTFPYWPDSLANPLVEVTYRMLGDDMVAPNAGRAIGVGGIVGVLPYLALVAALVGVALVRVATWRGAVLAAGLAAIWLVAVTQLPATRPNEQARVYKFVHAAATDF